ncbi:hypothetical protein PCANC_24761 [Puccinia coronata f. sp. avenae]|uniref:Uncharacterized protein n=1 Tax=Puccinia coronata f. sp. avenae TaxID=200324 RepID=A0A2N5TVQ9_9BASI|nr:hypothetical protein PCANC_24761 [Puccinia coronata f. sp. avenae]
MAPRASLPPALSPEQSILSSEIQQITPEELNSNISKAESTMKALAALKLPKWLKDKIGEFSQEIEAYKCVFEATGEIPKEEALKIHNPKKHARSPLTTTQKPPCKPKKPKQSHPPKAVDLLETDSAHSPEPDEEQTIVSPQSHPTPHASVAPLSTPNAATPNPSLSSATTFNQEAQTISPEEVFAPVDPRTQAPFPPPAIQTGFLSGQSEPIIASSTGASGRKSTKNPSIGSDGLNPGVPASSHPPPPPANHTNQTLPQDSNPSSQPAGQAPQTSPPRLFSILKSTDVQIAIMQIQQTVGGVKPSWERYQDAWKALQTLAKFRAASLQHPVPHQPNFQFERTTTSYPAWIKTIASLAPDFLSPSSNDLWNCPNIVEFTLLTKSIELEKSGSSEPFIPTTAKSTHSEATLVRFLGCLQHPPRL